jgi:hypothetical protein
MCPLCLSAMAWLALGGGSAASAAAVLFGIRRKGNDNGNDGGDASDRDA